MQPGLRVSLLGPVDILAADQPAGIAQQGLRILLAMLALSANRVVSVGALIEAIWHEDPSRQREKNLHVQVHLLRRRLAELEPDRTASRIVTAPPGYRLDLSQHELDVTEFAALARQGRQQAAAGQPEAASATFGEALWLWRGRALADVAEASARLEAEAAALEELRLVVLEDRAEADLAAGRHADLAADLPGLLAEHPLRERLRGQFMIALYRCGRQADALASYQQARQVLAEELGLDPGPQLQSIQRQILTADPQLDPPPRPGGEQAGARPAGHGDQTPDRPADPMAVPRDAEPPVPRVVPRQLPGRVRHFAGRRAELKELHGLLAQADEANQASQPGAGLVIVICGTAGVGKTALALHWAHEVAARFTDGQLHVNLRGYDPSGSPLRPAEVIRGFLDALGVPADQVPDSEEAQAGLYRSQLADKRMLIVLDNAREPDQVRPLLPGGPGCLVLVTSRSALAGLVAADGACPVPLGLLADYDAEALLAARLGPERTGLDPAATGQIIRLCARLPLALAITAARAASHPALPLDALAADLAGEQDRLDALDTGEQATSVRAVFSWSYQQLPEQAALLFRLLGAVTAADISAAAAASLAGLPRQQARRMLAELTTASMLTEQVPGRFVLHDLLRAYAAERAAEAGGPGELAAATGRLLDHYLHTAHAASLLLTPLGHPIVLDPAEPGVSAEPLHGRDEALAWFKAEQQALLAAVGQAAGAGFDRHAWQLAWTLRGYLDGQGLWQDWAAVNEIALAAAGRLDDHNGLGWTHHRMAQVCSLSGAIADGIEHNHSALEHFAKAGNLAGQGSGHLGLCISLGKLGDHQAALDHGQQALALFRAVGDRIGEAYMLHLVGLELVRVGEAASGRDHCVQAVELYGELADTGGLADAWHSLGTAHRQLGEHVEAIACFQQAFLLSAELDDRWGQAYCLIHLGDTHDAAGDLRAAREAWQQALDLLGGLHHPDADRVRLRLAETV